MHKNLNLNDYESKEISTRRVNWFCFEYDQISIQITTQSLHKIKYIHQMKKFVILFNNGS